MATPSPYATRQCSKCQGDTKFICTSCRRDLCSSCKEEHVIDINTIDHDVMIFRRKMTSSPIQENCAIHTDNVYDKYCETCELPMCSSCSEHTEHKKLDIKSLYDSHHQRLRNTFNVVRGKIHLYESVLMTGIKADVKTCQKEMCKGNASLILNATRLKDIVDKVLCDVELIHKCFVQNLKRHKHISSLVCSEHSFEQSAKDPVKFLSSKSAFRTLKERYGCAKHAKLSVTERLKAKGVTMLLSDIKVTEGRKRPTYIELKLMPAPVLQKSFMATDVDCCSHMAFVTSDKIWIGCENNFYLKDTNGDTLFHQEGPLNEFSFYNPAAYFTVTNEKDLVFINNDHNIVKLSHDMEKITTLINTPYNNKGPCCVHFAPFAGDLLVGFMGYDDLDNKTWINCYDELSRFKQTIQYNESGYPLFTHPSHIAENNNGDVAISDRSTVVVTDIGGRHRFSYNGGPFNYGVFQGICTDSLSHILVCDSYSSSVHMIDKDGHFLKYLLMRPPGILSPSSLTIDVNTHLLWVGSSSLNTVLGYRYITQYDNTYAEPSLSAVVRTSAVHSTVQTGEEHCFVNELLYLETPGPLLLNAIRVEGIWCCSHLSLVSAEEMWVSDHENLVLINTKGESIYHIKDLFSERESGIHTVTSDGELIYINEEHNIMRLSADMKTKTKFITLSNTALIPLSVYCSPFTGNLLVGVTKDNPRTGSIWHYNRDGDKTTNIQHNNSRKPLYRKPAYITENSNGDIVVSDSGLNNIVVTDREGNYRFSYTSYRSCSYTWFHGVCCDGQSNILICAPYSNSVQVIDKNGHFLSHFQLSGMGRAYCLSYEVLNNRLYAGIDHNQQTLGVYKYIFRQDSLLNPESISDDLANPIKAIQTTETKERKVGKNNLLSSPYSPILHKYLSITDVRCSKSVSVCATGNCRIWVSDDHGIVLVNELGETLHQIKDQIKDYRDGSYNGSYGLHTLNSDGELIYVAKDDTILKLSKDLEKSTTFIQNTDSNQWRPQCIYYSSFTSDIFVGRANMNLRRGKIIRFNKNGKMVQTIQCYEEGLDIFKCPRYITENNNEDMVVSDTSGAVVVTDRAGNFRFAYTGYPKGTALDPLGVSTDALSNILVSDYYTNTIHVIDKDGQFLSYLSINLQCVSRPCSIFFDKKTHLLWVGSEYNNTVAIYKYLRNEDVLEDQNKHSEAVKVMQHDVGDGTSSKKQIFGPAVQNYFTVKHFKRCSHLSYGICDCLLINEGNNFIITSTSGETIHHIEDLHSNAHTGSHSMNLSREELFYIEKDYNIVKLSKYKEKTKTTFIKCMQETDSAWRPWCLYCSQITDDVLVGMKKLDRIQGKVIRYNNLGEEIQEIQHNEIGSDIYNTPRYITENINGDVVVSDLTGAVVVTDREGRHRFSYKGHPPESELSPLGICTDTLSHILVCDELTHAIQILDKDGNFLSNLLIKPSGIVSPSCLCYDVNADLLWVGSDVNYSVCLYKYLSTQDLLTDENSEYEDKYEECCLVQADL